MFDLSLLTGLLIVWAVVTGVIVVLLIYRNALAAHEEEQLFLSEADNLLEREQRGIVKKEKKLAPFLYVLASTSLVLLLSIIGVWLWQGLLMT